MVANNESSFSQVAPAHVIMAHFKTEFTRQRSAESFFFFKVPCSDDNVHTDPQKQLKNAVVYTPGQ